MAKITCPKTRPQVATVMPGVFGMPQPRQGAGRTISLEPEIGPEDVPYRIVEEKREEAFEAGIETAEVQMSAATRGRTGAAGEEAVLPGVKNAIAVASGKGGVGKSTVAVNLAVALRATGASVGLMDADVYGPSLPLLLGVWDHPHGEKRDGKEWIVPLEAHGLKLMSIGFLLGDDSPVIWRGPMVGEMIRRLYGVRYHTHHIPRLLHQLGFSVQRPRKRLARADAESQAVWLRERLPAINKSAQMPRCGGLRRRGKLLARRHVTPNLVSGGPAAPG